jgi:uncharacterized protein (TIGR03083 family)
VPSSLDTDPVAAIEMCQSTYARFMARVELLEDEQLRRASRLPGWTVAHVLTHIARNADGHIHRLEGALAGADRPRYPGGPAQRNADIENGAGRGSAEILADLTATQVALERTWQRSVDAGWPHAGEPYPAGAGIGDASRRLGAWLRTERLARGLRGLGVAETFGDGARPGAGTRGSTGPVGLVSGAVISSHGD